MRRPLLALVLLALLLAPVAGTSGQEAGAVRADKEGWWNRTSGLQSGTPAQGVGPGATLPETVPEGAIGIAGVNGEPQKVAALGIVLDAERGSVVERFVLTLKEAEGTGAQQNAEGAAIVACPITDFFAGVENGAFADAPEADCELASAEGVRAEDGTWTFDLAAIADAWLDPFGSVSANGIRLDPGDATFQVSLTGMEDAAFDVSISPPSEDADPFDATPTSIAGGFDDAVSGGSGGGGSITVDPPPAVAPDAPATGGEPTPDDGDDAPAGADDAAGEEALPEPSRAGDTTGNQPLGAYLAVLAALPVLFLVSLHLGAARTVAPAVAGRGVSRALAARSSSPGGPA